MDQITEYLNILTRLNRLNRLSRLNRLNRLNTLRLLNWNTVYYKTCLAGLIHFKKNYLLSYILIHLKVEQIRNVKIETLLSTCLQRPCWVNLVSGSHKQEVNNDITGT